MTQNIKRQALLSRRHFFKLAGAAAASAGAVHLFPVQQAQAANINLHLAGTDGWAYIPGTVFIPGGGASKYLPDPLAPAGRSCYTFGFRDVTSIPDNLVINERGRAQISAPMIFMNENDDVRIKLSNLGEIIRPDLLDGHTVHWHGFRDAIPFFDGVPEMSVSTPVGRNFTYYYKPRNAGTYMYHCHFEDVEHVSAGMTGVIFVRPAGHPTWAYNDASTAFDRQFVMFMSEIGTQSRYEVAHIQQPDWSEYNPDAWMLNGRCYPDTLAPNHNVMTEPDSNPLKFQPISSLVKCNSGDKVLLRFVNLGYQQQAMKLAGIQMKVIAKDAVLLRGRDGTDQSYLTNTVYLGPGESVDALFTAPAVTSQKTFLIYNRNFARLHNPGLPGLGGQMTEVRVSPSGVPAQTGPNT